MIASLVNEKCNSESNEEVLAAVASLQNLTDELANLIQFIIVKNCIGTIISIMG
jgi:phosphoribosyl-ATP pyrophosphohydrolase